MEILLILLASLCLILLGTLLWLVFKKQQSDNLPQKPIEEDKSFLLLQQQLNDMARTIDATLRESSRDMYKTVQDQSRQSQHIIRETHDIISKHLTEVTRGVTEANEATKQIFTVAESLSGLEKVLKHQKQRGNLGERSLALILENILPPNAYKLQHHFQDGTIADAVILTKEGMIAIDAKFSLDNYNRLLSEENEDRKAELERDFRNDLKKRIDETAKYVNPKEGTLPFAFMYIPAEAIYYDLLVNEVGAVKANTRSMIDYAYNEKGVIIVSPTTFAAYLQSVLYGFRAFKIEESAKQIGKQVEQLSRHIANYEDYYKKLGNALSTTVNHYNAGYKEFGKIDKDIIKITGESAGIEPLALEKPEREE